MVDFLYVSIIILSIAIVLYLAVCLALVLITSYRIAKPKWHTPNPGMPLCDDHVPVSWKDATHPTKLGLPFKDVSFPSQDPRVTLRGWLIPSAHNSDNASRIAIVCVHGAGRDRRAFLRHSCYLRAAGYDVLLFDCTGHGASDLASKESTTFPWMRQAVTLGQREQYDVTAAIQFVRERGAHKVVILATSQGAVAALAAQTTQSTNGGAAIADVLILENAFLSPRALMSNVVHSVCAMVPFPLPTTYLVPPITWLALLFTGNADHVPSHVIAERQIALIRVPVMLVHGMKDIIVHYQQSQKLFQAVTHNQKQLWLLPNALHTQCFHTQPEDFERVTLAFLSQYLSIHDT